MTSFFLGSQEKKLASPSLERLAFVEPLTAFSPSCFCLSNLACSDQLPQSDLVFGASGTSEFHKYTIQKATVDNQTSKENDSWYTNHFQKYENKFILKKKTDLQTSSKPSANVGIVEVSNPGSSCDVIELNSWRCGTGWYRSLSIGTYWNHPFQHEKSSSDAFQCVRKKKIHQRRPQTVYSKQI